MSATATEMLSAVEDAIQAILTGGAVAEYSVGGKSLRRMGIAELYELRSKLKAEVNAGQSRTNYASFKEPS